MRCPAALIGDSRKTKTLGGVRLRAYTAKRGPGAWTCVRIDYLQPTASGQASTSADLRQASCRSANLCHQTCQLMQILIWFLIRVNRHRLFLLCAFLPEH